MAALLIFSHINPQYVRKCSCQKGSLKVSRVTPFVSRKVVANSNNVVARPVIAAESWQKMVDAQNSGESLEVVVKTVNKGGAIVSVGDIRGFIPYSLFDPSRLKRGLGEQVQLIGTKLKAMVVEVESSDPAKTKLVLSERQALEVDKYKGLQVGQVVGGVVTKVEAFGAFVRLSEYYGLTGLLHASEVPGTQKLTQIATGDYLQLKVATVDLARCRLTLSLKDMAPIPSRGVLNQLAWQDVNEEALPSDLRAVAEGLRVEEGVTGVALKRMAEDPAVATQELEAYLTKDESEGGFVMVLRLGTTLVEGFVQTGLQRAEVRSLLAKVLQRVVKS